jgi:hypothetical protein
MPKSPVNLLQQEFSANNLQMNMVLIDRAQESHQSLMTTLSFGIMVNSARLSRHTLLAFRKACLALAILNCSLLQHF